MWFNSKELTAWRMGSSIMVVPQVASRHQSEGIQLPPRVNAGCAGGDVFVYLTKPLDLLRVKLLERVESGAACSCIPWKASRVKRYHCQLLACLLKGLARCLEPENEEKGVSHIPAHLPLKSRGLKK
ncbi:uncharacterized protein LOC130848087 isoform X1 [Hippopotamus amphibius kiboko]|uniref:uncharacterized protein LOC130848087 isoform X1 n=1 Tax=Hippopotamus amphibius kiboko TaxID=575201 RepID=UPI002599A05F|nr:uncharacterized protein LOC130848087 isoform X1 [Hippopotamus amphibius kiboko]